MAMELNGTRRVTPLVRSRFTERNGIISPDGRWLACPSWSATTPSVVVKEGYFTNPVWWGRSYDVSPDGQRFLMIKEGGLDGTAPPVSLVVVQHWVEELKRLLP